MMSHDDAANRSARGTSRRRVSFQATMEDLEGRVLLSAAHSSAQGRPRRCVRHVPRPKVQVNLLALRRAQQLARLARTPTINVTPAINVNVTGGSVHLDDPCLDRRRGDRDGRVDHHHLVHGTGLAGPRVAVDAHADVHGNAHADADRNPHADARPRHRHRRRPPHRPDADPHTDTDADPHTDADADPDADTPRPPAPVPPTFADGTILVNAQTGEFDQYSGSQRHLISPPVVAKMGITPAQATSVPTDKFNLITQGPDYFPEGMFLRNAHTERSPGTPAGSSTWSRPRCGPRWGSRATTW